MIWLTCKSLRFLRHSMLPCTKITNFPNEARCPPKKNDQSLSCSNWKVPQTTPGKARAWVLSCDIEINILAHRTSEGVPFIKKSLALYKELVCISATHQKFYHFEDNCQWIPFTFRCESTPESLLLHHRCRQLTTLVKQLLLVKETK